MVNFLFWLEFLFYPHLPLESKAGPNGGSILGGAITTTCGQIISPPPPVCGGFGYDKNKITFWKHINNKSTFSKILTGSIGVIGNIMVSTSVKSAGNRGSNFRQIFNHSLIPTWACLNWLKKK